MCFQCAVYSSLMLFMPAPQAPSPVVGTLEIPAIVDRTASPLSTPQAANSPAIAPKVARDTQSAIAQMLKELPNSADTSLLREGLNALYARLATVKDDAEAQNLIDSAMRSLSERLKAQPNYDRIDGILRGMLEVEDDRSTTEASNSKIFHRQTNGDSYLKNSAKIAGWLR